MNFTIDNILLIGSLLLFISLIFSKTTKYGVPALILFLIVGMLAGSDGPGGIYFYDPQITKFIGIIALNFILFSGGLETKWLDIKPILWQGISLSTIGVLITTVSLGLFVTLITPFSLLEGLLLGAIVSSTDASAVFSIFRSKNVGLKGNLRSLLELESGSNDPMAYLLVFFLTSLIASKGAISTGSFISLFLREMIIGGLAGFLAGHGMHKAINWIKLDVAGLYSVFLLSMVILTYSFVDYVGGNGFLAVYISACILGNKDFIHKKSLIKHFDGQAWLMQIIMFITLGLLVFPKQIIPNIWTGLLISIFLMFLARPISVFLSLIFFKTNRRNRIFISWVGLRGAVPIVLATFPLTAGLEKSSIIFNIVFFISLTSILIQGTTISYVAKILNLRVPMNLKRKSISDLELAENVKSIVLEITIDENAACKEKQIVDLGLPSTVLISMIVRDSNKFIAPDGSTILMPGDKLTIMADNINALQEFYHCIGNQ